MKKVMDKFRRHFSVKTWKLWEMLGFHLSPNHFYWPIPDTKGLKKYNFDRKFPDSGIRIDDTKVINLLKRLKDYKEEYSSIMQDNAYESGGDGFILYSMVRHLKPKRIIEIGSGNSTSVCSCAVKRNKQGIISAIEPYPRDFLVDLAKKDQDIELIRKKVEDVGTAFFMKLREGDILFIDSSHNIKCGNDVHFIYLFLLPRIPVGTYIHIHDIRYPQEYPREWILKKKYFWNEQYMLQMFLCYNDSFEIIMPSNYVKEKYPEKFKESAAGLNNSTWPGSFWIKRIK